MIDFSRTNIRAWSMLGACGAFGIAAMELPAVDDRVVFLTSDLCFYSGLERFSAAHGDRLYNFGIAEQNMIGAAAGFAKEGFIPFATTYGAFAASRCMDQVRVNMGYMGLNIKLVGMTAGLSAGILGATHVSIEDLAVMRAVPNITVLSPADGAETIKAVMAAAAFDGPVYLRLTGAMGCPIVYKEEPPFEIGHANCLKSGEDIAILATGAMVSPALQAAQLLGAEGLCVSVWDFHTIKPLDRQTISACLKAKLIVTAEEHNIFGGFGSAVAEYLSERPEHPPLLTIGIDDYFAKADEYSGLLQEYGLSGPQMAEKIRNHYTRSDYHDESGKVHCSISGKPWGE